MAQNEHLYQVVYQELLSDIEKGIYNAGSRLPSEQELSDRFKVSKITTKKAMNLLAEEGRIIRRPGLGSFVCQKTVLEVHRPHEKESSSEPRGIIGLIMEDFTQSYGINMLRAIEKGTDLKGYNLCVKRSMGNQQKEEEIINQFLELKVDGLLVMPTHGSHYNTEILRLVVDGFPLVFVDRFLSGIPAPYVGTDNRSAAETLTQSLLSRGHSKIAMITAPTRDATTLTERYDGFIEAQKKNGLKFDRKYLLDNIYSTIPQVDYRDNLEEEVLRIGEFLRNRKEITAVFATEHGIATMVRHACRNEGLRIPEDISIVCFDGPLLPEDELFFTHMRQDEESLGRLAVDLLINQIQGGCDKSSCQQQIVPAILFHGASVCNV